MVILVLWGHVNTKSVGCRSMLRKTLEIFSLIGLLLSVGGEQCSFRLGDIWR